jgi:hypothetical protein
METFIFISVVFLLIVAIVSSSVLTDENRPKETVIGKATGIILTIYMLFGVVYLYYH